MEMIIDDRAISPTDEIAHNNNGPKIQLRISNGYSWAYEFIAQSSAELQMHSELAILFYMTKFKIKQKNKLNLELHVKYNNSTGWSSTGYGNGTCKSLFVTQITDWTGAWLQVLKCWQALFRLEKFLGDTEKFLMEKS